MRYWLIADDSRTLEGMRLGGVSGELVSDAAQAEAAVSRACTDSSIAVLLITTAVSEWIPAAVERHKLSGRQPLLAVIPGPDGRGLGRDSITDLIQQAIGVKIS